MESNHPRKGGTMQALGGSRSMSPPNISGSNNLRNVTNNPESKQQNVRVMEVAENFKIFKEHDEEERKPASILELVFDCEGGKLDDGRLLLMACSSKEPSGFTRTIDSWTLRPQGEKRLALYVRDTNNSWIKLMKPLTEYQACIKDARILADFLELAMKGLKFPKNALDRMEKRSGFSRVAMKKVLRKYYEPVVKRFVRSKRVPRLQDAPIIEKMESFLSLQGRTVAKVPKYVEEYVSDAEDHEPLLERQFKSSKRVRREKPTREELVKTGGMDLEDDVVGKGEQTPVCPTLGEDNKPPRWVVKKDLELAEEQEIQGFREVNSCQKDAEVDGFDDIAEIYGYEHDMPGEIGEEEELGDSAFCAICDDGGDLLFCDGPCMRSFHASMEAAAQSSESKCQSLGYTVEEVKEMGSWLCPNCLHKRHQCFICGKLGSSEGEQKEVFVCDVALCGRFYHPNCLGESYVKRITEGVETFCCPAHKCRKCKEGEEEGGHDNSMKLAKCRRCPTAYHKKCLPEAIAFEEIGDRPIRAWEIGDEDEPVKRLLIYCLKHAICKDLSTPKRNHIKWPEGYKSRLERKRDDEFKSIKRKRKYQDGFNGELTAPVKKKRDTGNLKSPIRNRNIPPVSGAKNEGPLGDRIAMALNVKKCDDKKTKHLKKRPTLEPPSNLPKISVVREGQQKWIKDILGRANKMVTVRSVTEELMQLKCYTENSRKNFIHRGELVSILNAGRKALEKIKKGGSLEDAKRLCPKELFHRLLRNEEMLKVYLAPFVYGMRYTSFGRHFTRVDKLKEIVDRVHWYIDDGDMVVDFCCGANDFSLLLKEKLDSIGKKCYFKNFDIHPPKDMPSLHLRSELQVMTQVGSPRQWSLTASGRSITRQDINDPYLTTKSLRSMLNDFNFTKGDWFEVQGQDFLEGKRLVMGLNPPFGVKAALATKFIERALTFKPKLLVLIVPPETMSNSERYKDYNYDLVWEDKSLLGGKSFYLPGSVDIRDKENLPQWNKTTPPLFLWSCAEMLRKHKEIAFQHRHIEQLSPDSLQGPLVGRDYVRGPNALRPSSDPEICRQSLQGAPMWSHPCAAGPQWVAGVQVGQAQHGWPRAQISPRWASETPAAGQPFTNVGPRQHLGDFHADSRQRVDDTRRDPRYGPRLDLGQSHHVADAFNSSMHAPLLHPMRGFLTRPHIERGSGVDTFSRGTYGRGGWVGDELQGSGGWIDD